MKTNTTPTTTPTTNSTPLTNNTAANNNMTRTTIGIININTGNVINTIQIIGIATSVIIISLSITLPIMGLQTHASQCQNPSHGVSHGHHIGLRVHGCSLG